MIPILIFRISARNPSKGSVLQTADVRTALKKALPFKNTIAEMPDAWSTPELPSGVTIVSASASLSRGNRALIHETLFDIFGATFGLEHLRMGEVPQHLPQGIDVAVYANFVVTMLYVR